MTDRRLVLGVLAALPVLGAGRAAVAQRMPITADEVSLGAANAPMVMIEYGSLACSHCADFHNRTFPAFKAKYVDTGQIRFVFREMLTGDPNFAGVGAIVARCAGQDRYFEVVDDIFREQAAIYAGGELRGPLLRIAQRAGLTQEQFEACIADRSAVDGVNERMRRWLASGVNSTPTFEIDGKRISGFKTLVELDAFIAQSRAP